MVTNRKEWPLFLDGFSFWDLVRNPYWKRKSGETMFWKNYTKKHYETGFHPKKTFGHWPKSKENFAKKKNAKIWTPASAPTRTLKHWITVYKTPMPEKIAAHSWHSFLGKDRIFGSSFTVKCTVTCRLRQNSMSSSPCCCFNNNTGTLGNWQLHAEQASAIGLAICGVEIFFLVEKGNRFGKQLENQKDGLDELSVIANMIVMIVLLALSSFGVLCHLFLYFSNLYMTRPLKFLYCAPSFSANLFLLVYNFQLNDWNKISACIFYGS